MYFNDDNIFFEYDNYENIDFNINSINTNRDAMLYSADEGFNKGNLFENLYSKYKNHVYKLKVTNEKDKLLYDIQVHCFVLKDLNLYLDLHPNDKVILKKYNEYKNKLNELKFKYQNQYGPLVAGDSKNLDKWDWIDNPWPWDKGGK